MTRWLSSLEPWGVLLLRLVLGAALVFHGHGKVLPAHGIAAHPLSAMEGFSHYVSGIGLPAWLGYVSALTEFVGGIFLIVGLLTRFTAFLISVNMLVALCAVTLHQGYAASEYPIALFAIAVMLVFTGGGSAAADRRLGLS